MNLNLTQNRVEATFEIETSSRDGWLLAHDWSRRPLLPRYDYECQTCHHGFELKQSFTSEPVADCPVCGNTARRVIHSVPVVFKGSGWYVNDYGKRGGATGSTSDSKDSGESESESESKSKSKSKPKAESSKNGKSDSKEKPKKESAVKK